MTLLDGDRQWLKSAYGSGRRVVGPENVALGALCVFDTEPRTFAPVQRRALVALARQASSQLETRRRLRDLELNERRPHSLSEQLDQFTYVVGHDLRAPIRRPAYFAGLMLEDYGDSNEEQRFYLTNIIEAGDQAKQLVHDRNEYVRLMQSGPGLRQRVSPRTAVDQVLALVNVQSELAVRAELNGVGELEGNEAAPRHILVNLVNNALKFATSRPARWPSSRGPMATRWRSTSATMGRAVRPASASASSDSSLAARTRATFTVSLPRD